MDEDKHRISLDDTSSKVAKFVENLKAKPTTNSAVLSKYDLLVNALQEIPETEVSPFVHLKLPFVVNIYPHRLSDLENALNETIDKYLLTSYVNGSIEGILLSYKEIKVPDYSQIYFDSGIITIHLVLDCVLFCPSINNYLSLLLFLMSFLVLTLH